MVHEVHLLIGRMSDACRPATDFKTAQPLLVLLLPLPLDVELLLLAPELRCALPFELVCVNRQLVLDGDLVIPELPHGGKRQGVVLQLYFARSSLMPKAAFVSRDAESSEKR